MVDKRYLCLRTFCNKIVTSHIETVNKLVSPCLTASAGAMVMTSWRSSSVTTTRGNRLVVCCSNCDITNQ
jgi:hypothetical protein